MLHVSVTGIRMSGLATLIPAAFVALPLTRAARHAPGCLRAGAFRSGDTVFAFSVWQGKPQMRDFENGPRFARALAAAGDGAALVETQRFLCETMPSGAELRALWCSARAMMAH